MKVQFVVINTDGKDDDWIDPVRKIEVDETSFFVTNDVGGYVIDIEPGYRYELRSLSDE